MTVRANIEVILLDPSEPPSEQQIQLWATKALGDNAENRICIKVIDNSEMLDLNSKYRNKHYTTNVLSFPCNIPKELNDNYLGDIALCAPVIKQQAIEQQKSYEAHFAHLVIHGVLHLLGYDHQQTADAKVMESMEIKLLNQLGYPNPYGENVLHE